MSLPAEKYDEAKQLARASDPKIRGKLADRHDLAPELLFFLAADPEARVRRTVAANRSTPHQANMLLAQDGDLEVRQALVHKVLRLLRETEHHETARGTRGEPAGASRQLFDTISQLTLDQAALVRRILAEALKASRSVPPAVIERLARDLDDLVSVPVLESSPLLTEESLSGLILGGLASPRLCAISRRRSLGAEVSDAIVGSDDQAAITELLGNHGAQIREDTLDRLVERAVEVRAWHEPLVSRPLLSARAVKSLAGFVARRLIDKLLDRADLDQKTAEAVLQEVSRRLEEQDDAPVDAAGVETGTSTPARQEPDDAELVATLTLKRAMASGDRDSVRQGLSDRSGLSEPAVERILGSGNAKALMALAWKASLPVSFAVQLQLKIGSIMPSELLQPKPGQDYPLSPEQMDWQLESFA